jgi:DNA invertase Pin-like site-specific DNA recombinase
VDAESAKNVHRPGLQRLLALVTAGEVQAVIVAKLDRLTPQCQRPLRAAGVVREEERRVDFRSGIVGH